MRLLKRTILGCTLLLAGVAWSQETDQEPSLEGGTMENQFEYLYSKSGNYNAEGRSYEVVRRTHLDKLRENVLDSLSSVRTKITELNTTISRQEGIIEDLNVKLEDVRERAGRSGLPVSVAAALLRRGDRAIEDHDRLTQEITAAGVTGDAIRTVAAVLALSLEPAQALRRWTEARQALASVGLEGSYADVAAAFGASDPRGP